MPCMHSRQRLLCAFVVGAAVLPACLQPTQLLLRNTPPERHLNLLCGSACHWGRHVRHVPANNQGKVVLQLLKY